MRTTKALLLAAMLSALVCVANGKLYLRSSAKGDNDNDKLRNGLKLSNNGFKLSNGRQLANGRKSGPIL